MKEEFVTYEQALSLKELGFDEDCFGWYASDKSFYTDNKITINSGLLLAPLKQQAFRWFREKYGYFTSPTESDNRKTKKYDWLITKNISDGNCLIKLIGYRDTYEEAESACIDELIKLKKS